MSPQHRLVALLWLLLALPGWAAAQYEIGARALERGDYAEAWLTLAPLARDGDPRAQNDVGIMHALGLGVSQSFEAAARWLERAAQKGNVAARARLGWMYFRGVGVEIDPARAAHWSRLAAEQGDAWAQSNYGFALDSGQGVGQDQAAAARWYRRSAEQGFPEAQRNLGAMYERGEGLQRDLVRAYAWYGVASVGGDELAIHFRKRLEGRLDAQALESARTLARRLLDAHGSKPELGG